MNHLPIEQTKVFQCFVQVANDGWDLVQPWDGFAKSTLGKQLVRSLDSIGANMAEGGGRYGTTNSLHLFVIARASARESKYWISVAESRRLVATDKVAELLSSIDKGTQMLNSLINYRRRHKSNEAVRELESEYNIKPNT